MIGLSVRCHRLLENIASAPSAAARYSCSPAAAMAAAELLGLGCGGSRLLAGLGCGGLAARRRG